MKAITKYGQILWVIGQPISHTLSPTIHNSAFEHEDLPHRYFAMEVPQDQLKHFLDTFRSIGALGANLTLPLKETICDLVDQQTDAVTKLSAANTLYWDNNRLCLDNTDVHGFMKLVEPWHSQIEESPVILLGAGGASRACIYALDRLNCPRIQLWNRTTSRAEAIREEFSDIPIQCLTNEQLENGQFDGRIVVNATSLGLDDNDPSPISEDVVSGEMIGVDLIYNRETAFMDIFRRRGDQAIGGLNMLVHQAARAWEHWIGYSPPVEIMSENARAMLRN